MKILLVTILSFAAMASTSINTMKTENKDSFLREIAPDRVSYFSIFSGPSLGAGGRIDDDGKVDEGSVNTWNQISFGWQLTEKTRFVFNPRFSINHAEEQGNQFEMENPVMGIATTYYSNDRFVFGGGINTIIPPMRKDSTKEDGVLFNPGGFQFADYKVTNNFSVGAWLWARAYIYDGTANKDDEPRLAFFTSPLIRYSFSDNLSTTLYYQIDGEQSKSNPLAMKDSEHFGLIASYSINKMLTIEPMITIFRKNGADLKKANFNMWISGRLF